MDCIVRSLSLVIQNVVEIPELKSLIDTGVRTTQLIKSHSLVLAAFELSSSSS